MINQLTSTLSTPLVSKTTALVKTAKAHLPKTAKALPTSFSKHQASSAKALVLISPEEVSDMIDSAPVEGMQKKQQKIAHFLKRQAGSFNLFQDMINQGLKHSDLSILPDTEVDKTSEFSRTIENDTRETLQGLKKMSPEEFADRKQAAYQHPEVLRDRSKAIDSGYYGSDKHKQYGALVSKLTAGIISAEEAMGMNPSGGIPGPGLKEVPLIGRIDAVSRHAMRHDATGFLLTRFNVGPGYGTPTSPIGMDKDNPMAGQWLGILRESVKTASVLPDFSKVGAPVDFA